MLRTLTWISPHRMAFVMAILTLIMVVIIGLTGIIFGGIMQFAYASDLTGNFMLGVGGMVASWIITPALVYLLTYLYCLLFNFVAGLTGGIDIRLDDHA